MKKKTLTERVKELERELEEMKAAPKGEQHFHYHYPPYRSFQQWPYPNGNWSGPGTASPSPATWTINSSTAKEFPGFGTSSNAPSSSS